MCSSRKFFLFVEGKKVPVSEEVYRAYHHYERKEEYFTYDLKAERFFSDQATQTAVFIPSREDSYERLLSVDKQFAADDESTEDTAIKAVMLERLEQVLSTLNEDDRRIIHELYYLERTMRQASADLNIARSTLQDRKDALLKKLRTLLENLS